MRKLEMHELKRLDIDTYKRQNKQNVIVILDNVRSMENVGSAFRTCDAFAVEELILCGITPKPPHRQIHRTALGATESVNWSYYENTVDYLKTLDENCTLNYTIIGVEQVENAVYLNDWKEIKDDKKLCFIFGNEVNGVEQNTLNHCNFCIEIPQWGTKHSLNISVSMGIVLWDTIQKKLTK